MAEPKPRGAPVRYTVCVDCDSELIGQRRWNALTPEGRADMRAGGFRRQGVGPRCTPCARRAAGGENEDS